MVAATQRGLGGWHTGCVPMRQDCKNFESRTYPGGETVRKCNLDLAPEAPWRCPDACPGYERRLADVNWAHGTLVTPPTPAEPPASTPPTTGWPGCSTRPRTSSTRRGRSCSRRSARRTVAAAVGGACSVAGARPDLG